MERSFRIRIEFKNQGACHQGQRARPGYSCLRGTPAWHLRRNSPRVGKPSRELPGDRPGEGYSAGWRRVIDGSRRIGPV